MFYIHSLQHKKLIKVEMTSKTLYNILIVLQDWAGQGIEEREGKMAEEVGGGITGEDSKGA